MAGFLKKVKMARGGKRNRVFSAATDHDAITGPSPNPFTNMLLATVALRGSGMLARRGIERAMLGRRYSPDKAKKIIKGRPITQTLLGAAAAKVATTSVPGAILVGGGLLAKTLYDRRKGRTSQIEGEKEMAELAEKGESTES